MSNTTSVPATFPPSHARTEMVQMVLPGDSNALGTVFGGKVLQWIDLAGAICARRHAKSVVVTASIDQVDFLAPAHVGDIMVLRAAVEFTGRSSMEIGVTVETEDPKTCARTLTTQARLTFVALDDERKPTSVPAVDPQTPEEKAKFAEGEARRKARKSP